MPLPASAKFAPDPTTSIEPGICPPPCLVCGAVHFSLWVSQSGYDIHRCQVCGLGGVYPLPDEQVVAAVYDESYLSEGGSFGYQDGIDRLEAQKAKQGRQRRDCLERLGYVGNRALDLGCGDGWWLQHLASDHVAVVGVEPMPAVRAAAATRLPSARLLASLSDLAQDERFDLITAFDVLEHLRDPWSQVSELTSRLAPGGILCIVVPIADHWTAQLIPDRWDQIKPPEHLWYFTRESLHRMTQRLGLETRLVASAWNRWPRPLPGLPLALQRPFRLPMKLLARVSSRVERGIADSLLWCAQKPE